MHNVKSWRIIFVESWERGAREVYKSFLWNLGKEGQGRFTERKNCHFLICVMKLPDQFMWILLAKTFLADEKFGLVPE